ncbi:hypothetical protein DDB_G0274619 [Dictyostelium discoideum AX4]|uniref:Transmembrane protein n=1 Tax=Dictyostelium discoideum TaxID=44689 RepID=Q554P1_DICDI|nr:hypothetical protein DDB_G0274619 [Dictyostelium discoideum AX4]EAL70202.1 hypothetical protein DDB_G0274619 [Dictyostelium discoideum AX4]|eukprot:XP_644282.1 hypothetical protein DDB_G0274619 [Dictyostelium discoideum AX4]
MGNEIVVACITTLSSYFKNVTRKECEVIFYISNICIVILKIFTLRFGGSNNQKKYLIFIFIFIFFFFFYFYFFFFFNPTFAKKFYFYFHSKQFTTNHFKSH